MVAISLGIIYLVALLFSAWLAIERYKKSSCTTHVSAGCSLSGQSKLESKGSLYTPGATIQAAVQDDQTLAT
jgi:hypothetical protein